MYIDLFICVLLIWAIYNGWRNGFLKEVFSTLGVISGLLIAAALYFYIASDYFKIEGSDTNQFLNIGAFLILWIVLPLGLGLVANILTVAIRGMMLGLPNSILGVVFSIAKFAILLSCVLNMMGALNILDKEMTKDSRLFEPTISIMPFVQDKAEQLYEETNLEDTIKDSTKWIYRDSKDSSSKDK